MSVLDAEGGAIFDMLGGRYSKNGAPNLDVYLRGHAGDAIRVDRTTRTSTFSRSAALTMALTAQPGILKSLPHKEILRNKGLLARFLYAMPETLVGTRQFQNRGLNEPLRAGYAASLRALLALPPLDSENPDSARILTMNGEAQQIWSALYWQTEQAQAQDGSLEHLSDFASKLGGAAARLAGILHLMEHGPQAPAEVHTRSVAGGWALAQYFLEHARAVFGEIGAGRNVDVARRIFAWLRRNQPERVTLGRLFDNLRRGADIATAEDLMPAVKVLEDHHVLRPASTPPPSRPGRKPDGAWEVNPRITGGVL